MGVLLMTYKLPFTSFTCVRPLSKLMSSRLAWILRAAGVICKLLNLCRLLASHFYRYYQKKRVDLLCLVATLPNKVSAMMDNTLFQSLLRRPVNRENTKIRDPRWKNQQLISHPEASKRKLESLENVVERLNKQLQESKRAVMLAKETNRRQAELLSTCQHELDAAIHENSSLVIAMNKLQQWTSRLSDDEAQDMMSKLYHSLDSWIKRHFLRPPSTDKSPGQPNGQIPTGPTSRFHIICQIHSHISATLVNRFLSRHMVAIENPELSCRVHSLDEEIEKKCKSFT